VRDSTELAEYHVADTSVRKTSLWWLWLLIVLCAIGGGGYFVYNYTAQGSPGTGGQRGGGGRGFPVVAATATMGDLPIYLNGLGTVTPFYTVTIKSRVDGQVDKVLFTEGQTVKENDPLIEIDPRPYQVQLIQAQGQLAKDQATYDDAKLNVSRDKEAGNAISQQQLDTDTATMNEAAGSMQADKGQIAAAQLNITYSHITSPVSGRIGLRLVDPGNIIHATDTTGLAVVTQLQPIAVIFTLAEDNILQVQKRMAQVGEMEVDAYARDTKTKLATGKLIAIDNMIDPNSGTVKLKASFDNTDNALFPNQFVNARLLVNEVKHTVLVPAAAIQRSPQATFVYVVKKAEPSTQPAEAQASAAAPTTGPSEPESVVEMRTVTVGPTETIGPDNVDITSVESGLQPGDVVVTDGVDKLQDGSKVIARLTPTMATTNPTTQSSTHPHRKRSE
jgi:membrane fusion protein, multidrug efflux system